MVLPDTELTPEQLTAKHAKPIPVRKPVYKPKKKVRAKVPERHGNGSQEAVEQARIEVAKAEAAYLAAMAAGKAGKVGSTGLISKAKNGVVSLRLMVYPQ